MAQDEQRVRLQRLRAARGGNGVRLEPGRASTGAGVGSPLPNPVPVAPKRGGHRGTLAVLAVICVVAGVVIAGAGYIFSQFHSAVGGPERTVRFVVKPGESVSQIASDLQRHGLVSNSLIFQLYYRVNGGSSNVQAGAHLLSTTMTMDQIATALGQAPPSPPAPSFVCCTFLAGKRVEEIAQLLDKYGVASYNDVMYQVRHGKFNYWFLQGRPRGASLEGFLYPGYYPVTKHYDAHRLIDRMLAAFGRYFTPAMHLEAARAHRSVYQIVTIASIVQRESALPANQRYIASVYYNRLTNADQVNGMLGADPTVQYALGYRPNARTWWEPHLTQYMIHQEAADSPYNTYTHPGLPPGPISNPGQDALLAALQPAKSPFLYFKVYPDGQTHFCATDACQIADAGVTVH